jgi:hypothetical protein
MPEPLGNNVDVCMMYDSDHAVLYQVIFLVLYCWFLGGKGTPGMFNPGL